MTPNDPRTVDAEALSRSPTSFSDPSNPPLPRSLCSWSSNQSPAPGPISGASAQQLRAFSPGPQYLPTTRDDDSESYAPATGIGGAAARGNKEGQAMKCEDIMNRNLEWLTEKDSVLKAATVMAEAGVGFLPICDSGKRVIGVVTDRDLTTRVLAKKIAPATTSAALVMSSPAITCLETADVRDAEQLMTEECKGRLVITDADGKLAGVLSLADLIEKAPGRKSLETLRSVLWREALGPRGGAAKGAPLLKDDPIARNQPIPSDDATVRPTVFTGGHRDASHQGVSGLTLRRVAGVAPRGSLFVRGATDASKSWDDPRRSRRIGRTTTWGEGSSGQHERCDGAMAPTATCAFTLGRALMRPRMSQGGDGWHPRTCE